MTAKEAKEMLSKLSPSMMKKSKVNPALTEQQVFNIVNNCIQSQTDDYILEDILEKRVYQVTRNQRRPRYN